MLKDVAISGDKNMIKKEAEKILKYEEMTASVKTQYSADG
jgi:hypothetical protein